MKDIIVLLILLLIVGSAAFYIWKKKKQGVKCIGCPSGGSCSCHCSDKETSSDQCNCS